jgi:ribonuclease VapC
VIVVDTSALIAIVLEEDLAQACEDALVSADRRLIAAPTLTEAVIVERSKQRLDFLEDLIAGIRLEVIEWNETRARNAAAGYAKYGYGSKTNALNYGDSFSYALAREFDCPLLFIGNDFSQTDVTPALDSQHG